MTQTQLGSMLHRTEGRLMGAITGKPWEKWRFILWETNITMENHDVCWENSLYMALFNSYMLVCQRVPATIGYVDILRSFHLFWTGLPTFFGMHIHFPACTQDSAGILRPSRFLKPSGGFQKRGHPQIIHVKIFLSLYVFFWWDLPIPYF